MPSRIEAIRRIRQYTTKGEHVAVAIWCELDVIMRAEERGINLKPRVARDIIDAIDRKQDCTIGITWDVIDCWLDEYIGEESS